MKSQTAVEQLNSEISILEKKQELELLILKLQLHETYDSLKPINIIKNTFKQITNSPEPKNQIINEFAGITAGALSGKLLFGKSKNPLKIIAGLGIQFLVSNFISRQNISIEGLKSIFTNFSSTKHQNEEEHGVTKESA